MSASSTTRDLAAHEQQIVQAVERLGFLSRPAIQAVWFTSERAARRTLARLVEEGRLRRTRLDRMAPAIYHLARWQAQAQHSAAVADAILLLRPAMWRREVAVPSTKGKADALLRLTSGRLLWLEVEHRAHGKGAQKVRLYRESCRESRARYPRSTFPDLLLLGLGEQAQETARRAMDGETGFRLHLSIEEAL